MEVTELLARVVPQLSILPLLQPALLVHQSSPTVSHAPPVPTALSASQPSPSSVPPIAPATPLSISAQLASSVLQQ